MAPKKKPTDELKDQRVPIMMSEDELSAIDDWRFANRIGSRGEAIRRLCQMGVIFDREIRPTMDAVTKHIQLSVTGKKEKLTAAEHQQMFQNMAISLFNAATILAKMGNDTPTGEAIKAVHDLYRYYEGADIKRKQEE